jgi:hypothetical protein
VSGGKRGASAAGGGARKACCMVSEVLEEAGLDRERLRQIRRQVLEGVVLMCQWQLQRMHEHAPAERAAPRGRRGRKIQVE